MSRRVSVAAAFALGAAVALALVSPLGGTPGAQAACGPGACLQVDAIAGGGVDSVASVSGTFDVDIVLSGPLGRSNAGSFNFVLTYNRSVLAASPPAPAGLVTSGWDCGQVPPSAALPEDDVSADGNPATGDALLVCFTTGSGVSGGVIARIRFNVIGAGASDLKLLNVAVGNTDSIEIINCNNLYMDPVGSCTDASVSTSGAPPPPPPPSGDTCTVDYAIDGETVQCMDGSRVRFIGVASPLGTDVGSGWATALTQWFLGGKTLTLEYDAQRTDEFGSRYGYPHITGTDGNDYNMSVLLIYVGMAHYRSDGVNVKYNDWLAASQVWARVACWNMWAAGNPFSFESGCR